MRVLDDGSADATGPILARLAESDGRLIVMRGHPLPEGWTGKNWACDQLAGEAEGDVIYFTDADTCHAPDALRMLVACATEHSADLRSGFPSQELGTWAERLIVPFFSWALHCFLPLPLAYWTRLPVLAAAIGQTMLLRRPVYEAIGGHWAVRDTITDDLSLARKTCRHGYRWRMAYAAHVISCRMYESTGEALRGFSKNLFVAFGFRLVPCLFVWIWLWLVFVLPLAELGLYVTGSAPGASPALLPASIALSLALWVIPYTQVRVAGWLGLLHPVNVLAATLVVAWSLVGAVTSRLA